MFAVRRAAVLPARVMRVCGVPRAAGASVARMSDDTYDKRRQGLEKQFFNKQGAFACGGARSCVCVGGGGAPRAAWPSAEHQLGVPRPHTLRCCSTVGGRQLR